MVWKPRISDGIACGMGDEVLWLKMCKERLMFVRGSGGTSEELR